MDYNYREAMRLVNQLCFPLYAAARNVTGLYTPWLKPLGLTYTQYIVMMILWEYGGMTEGELGKIIHLESGTLAPLLKRLEKQGLISRVRPEDNERKLFIDLTEKGQSLSREAEAVPCAMRGRIPLEDEELLQLRALLCKAMQRMHDEED